MSKDFFLKLCDTKGWLKNTNKSTREKIFSMVEHNIDIPNIATAVWMCESTGVSREEIIHDIIDSLDNGIRLPNSNSRYLNWEEIKYLSTPIMDLRKVLYSSRLCIEFSLTTLGSDILLYGDAVVLLSITPQNAFDMNNHDTYASDLPSLFYDNFVITWNKNVPEEAKSGILDAVLVLIIKLCNYDVMKYHVSKVSYLHSKDRSSSRREEINKGVWEIIF